MLLQNVEHLFFVLVSKVHAYNIGRHVMRRTRIMITKIDHKTYGYNKYKPALAKNSTIGNIKNQVQAKKELETVKTMLSDALPFFEKARECTPDEPMKWAFELKTCYSVTGNAAKAAEMDKLL